MTVLAKNEDKSIQFITEDIFFFMFLHFSKLEYNLGIVIFTPSEDNNFTISKSLLFIPPISLLCPVPVPTVLSLSLSLSLCAELLISINGGRCDRQHVRRKGLPRKDDSFCPHDMSCCSNRRPHLWLWYRHIWYENSIRDVSFILKFRFFMWFLCRWCDIYGLISVKVLPKRL